MASNLSSIGFPSTRDSFADLAHRASQEGEPHAAPLGTYIRWAVGGGPELWVQVRPTESGAQEIVGLNPHFEGSARMSVGITATVRDPDHPLDGRLDGWANPSTNDPEAGDFPFSFDLPDFDLQAGRLRLPAIREVALSGFARQIRCWDDEAAYQADQKQRPAMATQSFIPVGQFATWQGPVAAGLFTGVVVSAQLKVNPISGLSYYHATVETLGGQVDVVADPEICAMAPTSGGIIQATCWLSGRLVEADPQIH